MLLLRLQRSESFRKLRFEVSVNNNDKFVTNISSNTNNYRFGVNHDYTHLGPIWQSIKDELLHNDVCPIGKFVFINLNALYIFDCTRRARVVSKKG